MLCLRLNSEIEGALLQLPGGDEPVWEQRGEGARLQTARRGGRTRFLAWARSGRGREGATARRCEHWLKGGTHLPLCESAHTSDLEKSAALISPIVIIHPMERDGHEFC